MQDSRLCPACLLHKRNDSSKEFAPWILKPYTVGHKYKRFFFANGACTLPTELLLCTSAFLLYMQLFCSTTRTSPLNTTLPHCILNLLLYTRHFYFKYGASILLTELPLYMQSFYFTCELQLYMWHLYFTRGTSALHGSFNFTCGTSTFKCGTSTFHAELLLYTWSFYFIRGASTLHAELLLYMRRFYFATCRFYGCDYLPLNKSSIV